jgi:HD-GYP domain-containing protein (c-di-GMP phosphodiesterase class II)
VHTKLGGLLFNKNRYVSERDIEILTAFLVPTVVIEKDPEEAENAIDGNKMLQETANLMTFYREYAEMVSLIKRVFNAVGAGQSFPILDIRTRLEALLRSIDQYNALTFSPKNTVIRDYLYHNSVMVCLTSYQLARWHGFQSKDLIPIAMAGLFHDIGNAKVDQAFLEKTSRLTLAEIEEIRKHTVFGYQILKNVPAINEGVKLCALQHHEKEDGSGYPLGLTGEKIHIYSKVIAVADIYHAMTNHRAYKRAQSPYLVLEQIVNDSFGKLDPLLVQTFIQKLTQIHNGTLVKLSDNRIGEIIFTDNANPTRPWVNVNGSIVNLTRERNLYIQEVLQK